MVDMTMKDTQPNLGVTGVISDHVVKVLNTLLADEMVLYAKLRKYHWNVTGTMFGPLHELFERQYDAIAGTIDEVAEYIRQYGAFPIGTLAEFQSHTRLSEMPGVNPPALEMVAELVNDHEAIIRALREDIDAGLNDVVAEDLLIGIIEMHQKQAWLLRAHLEG